MRLCDAYLREQIYLLWLMEGGRFLRVHNGQCFLYHDSGAFQVFRGSLPEQTVARMKEFILQLEGLFRTLPEGVDRTVDDIVKAVEGMEADVHGNFQDLYNRWTSAAIIHGRTRQRRGPCEDEKEDDENIEAVAVRQRGGSG